MTDTDGPVDVQFTTKINGLSYGHANIARGDIIEVATQAEAKRLFAAGLAQPVGLPSLLPPYTKYVA